MTEKIIDILLVEDNPDDIEITKRAFRDAKILNKLYVVRDGQEAIDFLFHQGEYRDPVKFPTPGLVLLDINMPRMNGIEVLKRIKGEKALRALPVIMLTVSRRDKDIIESYDYGCNSFIQKPVEFDKFIELVRELGLYWGLHNISIENR